MMRLQRIASAFILVSVSIMAALFLPDGTLIPAASAASPRFLTLPFPSDGQMRIQQGWHEGIDYIKGSYNKRWTWAQFDVLAAADGWACGNCASGPSGSQSVWIRHSVGGATYYTYYGHLSSIAAGIPRGSQSNTVWVGRGQNIGRSGDTGTTSGWVHLHFGLHSGSRFIDPYDKYSDGGGYPSPNCVDSRRSGANSFWTANPPSHSSGPYILCGDLNRDTRVDLRDYTTLWENFGNTSCGNIADISGDCRVNMNDYTLLFENYGKTW